MNDERFCEDKLSLKKAFNEKVEKFDHFSEILFSNMKTYNLSLFVFAELV